jgi:hypothetical protein
MRHVSGQNLSCPMRRTFAQIASYGPSERIDKWYFLLDCVESSEKPDRICGRDVRI